MAILKKGSKGADVKKLQDALNKNGAKLKVDGDFGKMTESAVKTFQKKAKLKVDGQVGPQTQAALKSGGALPEMTVEDYTKVKAILSKNRGDNRQTEADYVVMSSALNALDSLFMKDVTKAMDVLRLNDKHWEVVDKEVEALIKLQKDFEAKRLSDPKAAAKIAKDCATKDKVIKGIAEGKIGPNRKKANGFLGAAKKRLRKTTGTLETIVGNIEARSKA
ncbi:MAG: peptidoglycan-binding domain-containing protein [Pseudomonadota bacterium]